MALQPFTKEQLNYFKFGSIVLDEFPRALRQTFVVMWNNTYGHLPGHQVWDDSPVVRNLLLAAEGGATKIPTNTSINDWDCTALFQATIFARSFALPDSAGHRRSLSDLYVKPRKLLPGTFHPSVISPSGNMAETFALAIDQLRLLRNKLCHSAHSKIDKMIFDQWMQRAKEAFTALGVNTAFIDAIGSLTESDFPSPRIQQLEETVKSERQALIKFLEDITESGRERQEELMEAVGELKELQIRATDEVKRHIGQLSQEIRRSIEDLFVLPTAPITALQTNEEKEVSKNTDEDGEDREQTQTTEKTEDHREIAAEVKKGTPSSTELEKVAVGTVDVWRSLGRRLGFYDAELTAFHKQNEKYSEKSYQMLLSWKHRNANDATYQALNVALRHELVGRQDLAIQFCCDK